MKMVITYKCCICPDIAQRIAKERSMQILTSQPLVNRVNVPTAAYVSINKEREGFAVMIIHWRVLIRIG